jgi:hypothetical protein
VVVVGIVVVVGPSVVLVDGVVVVVDLAASALSRDFESLPANTSAATTSATTVATIRRSRRL